MADNISLNISGLDKVFASLNKLSDKIKTEVALEMNSSALNIQSNAKRNAPVNMGTLRNSIALTEQIEAGKLTYTVGSKLNYAPYIEFGTGGKVDTQGYDSFAMQFKSKGGGTFKELVKALMEWVNRKGITGTYSIKSQKRTGNKAKNAKQDQSVAYAIALSIIKKGLRPQPFLIPAYESEKPKLLKKINDIIRNAKS
jgi:HK97 gp10 family phage protein